MPCYVTKTQPASRQEYEQWQRIGYTGSYGQYAASKRSHGVVRMFICGPELDVDTCADCLDMGLLLCDFPVGDGKTCDRPMCEQHSHEIGQNLHYCEAHYKAWRAFVKKGGVNKELRNVVAFKGER